MRSLLRFSSMLALLLMGCSGDDGASLISSPEVSVAATRFPASEAKADEAVRQVLDGLRQGKARALWDFLPPSYREDIQHAVRDMAARLDKNDWRHLTAVVKKARRVLSEKKPALLGTDVSLDRPSSSAIILNLPALIRILEVAEEDDFSDLERLQSLDVGQFLDTSGDRLLKAFAELSTRIPATSLAVHIPNVPMNDPLSGWESIQAILVSSEGDQAVLRFHYGSQLLNEYDFVRVDGHWIPKSLADGWASGLAETRSQCLAWADGLRDDPESWKSHIDAIDSVLDALDDATTAEESQQQWQLGLQKLVGAWLGSPPATSAPSNVDATETSGKPSTTDHESVTMPRKPKPPDTEVLLPDEP